MPDEKSSDNLTPLSEIKDDKPASSAGDIRPSPLAKKADSKPTSPPPPPAASKLEARGSKPPPPGPAAVVKRGIPRFIKVLLIFLAIIALGAGAFFLFFYRAQISIFPNPAPDKILLDGQEIQVGKFRLFPGTHSIVIEKDGYISYRTERDFKINERLNLSLSLQEANKPTLVAAKARLLSVAKDGRSVNFLSGDGILSSFAGSGTTASALSNGTYKDVRQLIFSDQNDFALILDAEALRILDFARSDTLNQVEAKLPPAASSIHSIVLNSGESQYFPSPNSNILYDMESSSSWDLILANRAHSQAQIVMSLDKNRFSTLQLDWAQNDRRVLVVGGELGVLDLATREYQQVESEAKFAAGSIAPGGQYALALDTSGEVYLAKDLKAQKLNLQSAPGQISWLSPSEAVIVSAGRPVKYNFDTNAVTNYAEISGLKSADSFAVMNKVVYFTDTEGLKSAPLVENTYKKDLLDDT